MKDLAKIIERLEKLQADLSRLSGSWPEPAARTIRRAAYDISVAKTELRILLIT